MISAVDTNVFLDVVTDDAEHADASQAMLMRAYDEGSLIVRDIVYAELVPSFETRGQLDESLRQSGIKLSPSDVEVAYLAGAKWAEYRKAGDPREAAG